MVVHGGCRTAHCTLDQIYTEVGCVLLASGFKFSRAFTEATGFYQKYPHIHGSSGSSTRTP